MKRKLIILCFGIVLMSLVEIFGPENEEIQPDYSIFHPIATPEMEESVEGWLYVWEPIPEPNDLLDWIPTWPEYIELDKDLVIDNSEVAGTWPDLVIIQKGTKIYFREDE